MQRSDCFRIFRVVRDDIVSRTIFTQDMYETDGNTRRAFFDRVSLNTRFYFMLKYVSIVLRTHREALRGEYDTDAWIKSSLEVFRLIERCGGRFHLMGLNNIRTGEGPVVFVGNHMSTLETMTLPCIVAPDRDVTFAVKESLIRHPFFGAVMRTRDPIVVGRENSREDLTTVLTKGKELLSNGTSVIIFPQSTRMVKFIPEKFNSLGVKLAAGAGVRVVPFAIKTDYWEIGKLIKDLGKISRSKPIYMSFGEPLVVSGTGKNENAKVIEYIIAHLREWGAAVA